MLDAIVEHKRVEVLKRKQKRSISNLNSFPFYRRKTNQIDLAGLADRPGIIAEFKRKSPSKGTINSTAEPVEIARDYTEAGAAAMSILTDRDFFGGSFKDLLAVRQELPDLTLLRKDFMIDPYQLHEASAYGADMILLIASILEKSEVADMAMEARSLGLQVLLEVHSPAELNKFHPSIGYVGVNNRNLKTFKVDPEMSLEVIRHIPEGVLCVSESGISSRDEIEKLGNAGFKLFLIGEAFMKHRSPGMVCKELIAQLR